MYCQRREETLTPDGISMIEMPVRPTLDIMSTGHNIYVLSLTIRGYTMLYIFTSNVILPGKDINVV